MPELLRTLADRAATDRIAAILAGLAVAIYMLAILRMVLTTQRKNGEGE
jgi:hypothetical protein